MAKIKHIKEAKFNKRRSRLMINYFFNSKKYILAAICFFILAAGCGVAAVFTRAIKIHYLFGGLTILLLFLVILICIRSFSKRMNYVTLEKVLGEDHEKAFSGLFKHLALNNNRKEFIDDPIEIRSAELYPGRNKTLYRYEKKNGKLYYSNSAFTWVLFGEDKLFLYRVSVNHIHGYVGYEEASEVAYTDIVNVKTQTTRKDGLEYLEMSLSLIDGNAISLLLRCTPNRLPKYQEINGKKQKVKVTKEDLLEGSTKALTDKEADIIARIRKNIRSHK